MRRASKIGSGCLPDIFDLKNGGRIEKYGTAVESKHDEQSDGELVEAWSELFRKSASAADSESRGMFCRAG